MIFPNIFSHVYDYEQLVRFRKKVTRYMIVQYLRYVVSGINRVRIFCFQYKVDEWYYLFVINVLESLCFTRLVYVACSIGCRRNSNHDKSSIKPSFGPSICCWDICGGGDSQSSWSHTWGCYLRSGLVLWSFLFAPVFVLYVFLDKMIYS